MNTGYGQLRRHHRHYLAHRYSYLLVHGELPDDKFVCHSCDNRKCVNPDHLWLGTRSDNVRDAWNKGRGFLIHEAAPDNRGEKQGRATLTNEQALAIRRDWASGTYTTQSQLVRKYGVGRSTISRVLSRFTWAHLPEEGSLVAYGS